MVSSIRQMIARALTLPGVGNDNRLAHAIGISRQRMHEIRHGSALPGEQAMMRLAVLLGESPAAALLELASARAERDRDALSAAMYSELKKYLTERDCSKIANIDGLFYAANKPRTNEYSNFN